MLEISEIMSKVPSNTGPINEKSYQATTYFVCLYLLQFRVNHNIASLVKIYFPDSVSIDSCLSISANILNRAERSTTQLYMP